MDVIQLRKGLFLVSQYDIFAVWTFIVIKWIEVLLNKTLDLVDKSLPFRKRYFFSPDIDGMKLEEEH